MRWGRGSNTSCSPSDTTEDHATHVACLSPFRHVVRGLKDTVGKQFPRLHIGTVHTYQGKEQHAIVLVLGGNVNAEGPLDWAARRPNLLNVALTRAKRRIYVVGNRERWRTRAYFRELERRLPPAAAANPTSETTVAPPRDRPALTRRPFLRQSADS